MSNMATISTLHASDPLVERAENQYASKLKTQLEPRYQDCFVAIEPDSGQLFLGKTMRAAIEAASQAFPQRMTYVKRIGHTAVIRIGAWS
jgi:hypothetical protein